MAQYIPIGLKQGTGQDRQKQQNEWDKYLAQARMATMLDGQTALGLALGRLLRGAWDHERDAARRRKLDAYNNSQELQHRMDAGTLTPDDVQGFRAANPWARGVQEAAQYALNGGRDDIGQPRTAADGAGDVLSSLGNAGMELAKERAQGTLNDYIARMNGRDAADGILWLRGLLG